MPDLSKRNKTNKRKGADYEIGVQAHLAPILPTRRLTRTGRNDEGDLVVELPNNTVLVVECKNEKTINLSQYVQEAMQEAINYQSHRVHAQDYPDTAIGVAFVKRRNHSIDKSYAVMEVGELIELILRVSGR